MIKYIESKLNRLSSLSLNYRIISLARSLLALGLLLTLLSNNIDLLINPTTNDFIKISNTDGWREILNIFDLLAPNYVLAKWVSIIILVIVISGYFPAVTSILHWWVTSSFIQSSIIVDGGDHISAILTLLLIPILVFDNRRNHWKQNLKTQNKFSLTERVKGIHINISIVFVRLQVAIIYLNSASAKLFVDEWSNGTALYYWLNTPNLKFPDHLGFLFYPIITDEVWLPILTWGIILVEFFLFAGIFAKNYYRRILLLIGILFHFLIWILFGLFTFFLTMTAALILFLIPWKNEDNM